MDGEVVEQAEQAKLGEMRPKGRRRRRAGLVGTAALALVLAVVWTQRISISENLIERELEKRGVAATYRVQMIGLRTQRLTDLVIGSADRPNLTAKNIEIRLNWGWTGPSIDAVQADGVRLFGRFQDGKFSLGELDKFSDPESDEPFELPNFDLKLSDARLALITPWGPVGASVAGNGNLSRNFKGELAVAAPKIVASGCAITGNAFLGRAQISSDETRLIGPLHAKVVKCNGNGVGAQNISSQMDIGLFNSFSRWDASAKLDAEALKYDKIAAKYINLTAKINGNSRSSYVAMDADIRSVSGPQFQTELAELRLSGDISSAKQMVDGRLIFSGGSASPNLQGQVAGAGTSFRGTPLEPLADVASANISAAMRHFGGNLGFALSNERGAAEVSFKEIALVSANGVKLDSSNGSLIRLKNGAQGWNWTGEGHWGLKGGGVPQMQAMVRKEAGSRYAARIDMEPFAAKSARFAMASLEITGAAGEAIQFKTLVNISGPVADGRIDGLELPIAGHYQPKAGLAINGGCHVVKAQRVALSGYALDRPQVQLCSAPGQNLLRYAGNRVSGQINIPQLNLRGVSSDNSLAATSGRISYDLGRNSWTANSLEIHMAALSNAGNMAGKTAEAAALPATHFAIDQLNGQASRGGAGMSGQIKGAKGRLAAVPLNLSGIDGDWQWLDGGLHLNGKLVLTDAEAGARFNPLIANNADFRFSDGKITALASFAEQKSGRKILDADIRHLFSDGSGEALLKISQLHFDEQFQPSQLSRIALGVVAEVEAIINGNAFIRWKNGDVISGATFSTRDANLAAAFGPVTGLSGTMIFDDLLDLHTLPKQRVTIQEINPGIPIFEGEVEYALVGGNKVRIEGGTWPLAGGELKLHPTTLNFAEEGTRHLSFEMIGIDAAHFMQRFEFENLNVTGLFDGSLPVEFGGLGGRIVDGRIDSREGGGTIEYVGELSNRNLGAMANFAFGALRALTYTDLSVVLNGALDGEMVTDIRFGGVGQGKGATQNFLTRQIARIPLAFNVKVTAPFRALFTTVQGLYDPTVQIEEKLPELIKAQDDLARDNATKIDAVQPLESEPVQ